MPKTLTGAALAECVHGALEVELSEAGVRPWRLPSRARRHAPPALSLMSEFTAGVRLRLRTRAGSIALSATVTRLQQLRQTAEGLRAAVFVATAGGEVLARVELHRTALVRESADRTLLRGTAEAGTVRFELNAGGPVEQDRVVELWLPQDAAVLLHELSADAPLHPAGPAGLARWVHYGSSISHGGSAGSPLDPWPRQAAALLGLDGVNLGFGGNAMLDAEVARAIGATPAAAITLKLGINLVGGDAMRRRTFIPAVHHFLDLIREAQAGTPIALITAIGCAAVETTPGPIRGGEDGRVQGTPRQLQPGDGTLTLEATRQALAEVVAARADDPQLFLVDGLGLLGLDEQELLPDGLHPGPEGHGLIAKRFAAQAQDAGAALGRCFSAARSGTAP